MKYLILSKKQWNKKNYYFLNKKFKVFFSSIKINEIKKNERIIFFIHWSEKIPSKIFWFKYLCIQFHSSNLPKFKEKNPIQNQIMNNIKKLKLLHLNVNV